MDDPAPKFRDLHYSYDKPPEKEYVHREIELPLNSPGLMLLRKLRDEAHRFAITGHRQRRKKQQQRSALEDIAGIGSRRRQQLLLHFGGLQGIRKARPEELAKVPGINKNLAQKIYDTLHD